MSTTNYWQTNSTDSWQVLPVAYGLGEQHMARDLALLAAFERREISSTFYLSLWTTPVLSLGYHQAAPSGVPWVRRPTGGRGVWHCGEISYSLITHSLGNLPTTYAKLSQILRVGLGRLGVMLDLGTDSSNYLGQDSCFAHLSPADLCWRGRKVVGSAQLRRGKAVLQQGSILLEPDYEGLNKLFPGAPLPICGLREICGFVPEPELLRRCLAFGIAETFLVAVQVENFMSLSMM